MSGLLLLLCYCVVIGDRDPPGKFTSLRWMDGVAVNNTNKTVRLNDSTPVHVLTIIMTCATNYNIHGDSAGDGEDVAAHREQAKPFRQTTPTANQCGGSITNCARWLLLAMVRGAVQRLLRCVQLGSEAAAAALPPA